MDLDKLRRLLVATTVLLRKGDVVHGDPALVAAIERGDQELPGGVVTFDMMPAVAKVRPNLVLVDVHFAVVGVDKAQAQGRREEFIGLLREYPNGDRLYLGPSYIEVGAEVGDQGLAFQLFALGEVLGLWKVITPRTLGITGLDADEMAGRGLVMMTGFKDAA